MIFNKISKTIQMKQASKNEFVPKMKAIYSKRFNCLVSLGLNKSRKQSHHNSQNLSLLRVINFTDGETMSILSLILSIVLRVVLKIISTSKRKISIWQLKMCSRMPEGSTLLLQTKWGIAITCTSEKRRLGQLQH